MGGRDEDTERSAVEHSDRREDGEDVDAEIACRAL
jgi:hypothetical protein